MTAGLGIINTMHRISGEKVSSAKNSDILIGEVTQVNPLLIKVSDKMMLNSNMLILHACVKETWINVPYHEAPNHVHVVKAPADSSGDTIPEFNTEPAFDKIKLWRGLKIGDSVRILRYSGGQMFYVLERVEGITNDSE